MRSTHSYFHRDAVAMLKAKDAEIARLRAEREALREALEELMRAKTNQQFAAAGQKARAVLNPSPAD